MIQLSKTGHKSLVMIRRYTNNPIELAQRICRGVSGRLLVPAYIGLYSLYRCGVGRLGLAANSRRERTWLIGENRGDTTKENGYHFFRYLRRVHPEEKAVFISKLPAVALGLEPGDVVSYGSMAHARSCVDATIMAYTHTYRDLIYRRYFRLVHHGKSLVYLHHGVLGFKKFNPFYEANKNLMDIFIVGSEFEKEVVTREAGVDPQRVRLTGHPRCDTIRNAPVTDRIQIAYIPTHRNYIAGNFRSSTFYTKVTEMLSSSRLEQILLDNNAVLKFKLHPEMRVHSGEFASSSSLVQAAPEEETVGQLLAQSHILLTDYSSVCWDFFFLGKPVIFFRFDIEDYLLDRDSYIDLRQENIGQICYRSDEVCAAVKLTLDHELKLLPEFERFRREILPQSYTEGNCERVYQAVVELDAGGGSKI